MKVKEKTGLSKGSTFSTNQEQRSPELRLNLKVGTRKMSN